MSNVLVIGNGGREHAICWKLAQSPKVQKICVTPGNVGITKINKAEYVQLDIKDHKVVVEWCKKNNVTLVVVGPEDPLAGGIADSLQAAKIQCFGPIKDAAKIESNKDWSKSFMDRHNIPTARWKSFTSAEEAKLFISKADYPALVVKASGLAAGKGVIVSSCKDEACSAVESILNESQFGDAGSTIVVEERLEGEEISVLAFSDGSTCKIMLPSQDHKRHLDGDKGENTGGMGAYCPCPLLTDEELKVVEDMILKRAIAGLKNKGTPFIGVLYAGLMITKDGPKVLEFNCRFGDPETQVILPLLETDLYEVMKACCDGRLDEINLKWKHGTYAVGVVMASRGYPKSSSKGDVITGLDDVERMPNYLVFHSGTDKLRTGELITNGGRVLIVVNLANELPLAAARATKACGLVKFSGSQNRKDIAHNRIIRSIINQGRLTYKDSGVDIAAGDALVSKIKPCVERTKRSGVMGSIGGFGGLFDIKAAGYKDPILVSGTDGVGTKLKVAQLCKIHSTVGTDLVAMCVNDILAQGAEPLFFLDYFACGSLDVNVAAQVVEGVAEGCRQASCALIGGETAEMPDMYLGEDYDLAGFAVGAVERSNILPRVNDIKVGDTVIGLASSGLHSNGFSLVRKVMDKSGTSYTDVAPFSTENKTFGEELLKPTKIYVHTLEALKSKKIKALAHITGGGLKENIPRVLPKTCKVVLDASKWTVPHIFGWLAAAGNINESELLRTFNCGIGVVLIVDSADEELVVKLLKDDSASVIGKVESLGKEDSVQVEVRNFAQTMEMVMRPYMYSVLRSLATDRVRVGVLISGSGTNLQALIDATTDLSQGVGSEIVLVISNKSGVEGLKRAERANIPTMVINHKDYPTRVDFDMALSRALTNAGVKIVCLAGFMRILTGEFVRQWRGRLINIHPSLLPSFKGTHAHRQVLEAGVRITGCTAHFVEEAIDAGAILAQEAVPVEVNDTEESLQERVKVAEHKVFPIALKLVATGQVSLDDNGKLVWKV